MRAVACVGSEKILADIELPRPKPLGRDLLVAVRAVSANPVDVKVRQRARLAEDESKVLGWDASGVVVEVGEDVTLFKEGDEVYYAGDITRPGTNAEFHLVDERIVGNKPKKLSWLEAAALPLTTITAWEALFDRLKVQQPVPGHPTLLIIGGGGGVGSMAIQLASALSDLTVVATASRQETRDWAKSLGAHVVIDHSSSIASAIAENSLPQPGFIFSTTHTQQHLADVANVIAPQGRFALIDDPEEFDIKVFKTKSVSVHWEYMFARPMHKTMDVSRQGEILNEVARLVDDNRLKTTLGDVFGNMNAQNIERAHAFLESGRAKGKIVLDAFS